ncbi:Mov34/MPN/PAD-1 family protein [Sphingobacterium sp. 40-24]|uniref:Mov34/MPN/PAD-1 family protein n=1 Tax=Sphingobacterium sp. 40-24 TaxID=1895843 RepID=UPI00096710E1|nr:Mov34/MPN/PAD-1 family protein [Sphingobacterium sp. 40-24]OJZ04819.1 MAG: hypothetical protein BGP15_22680 [Sphingobacterium sp. 40-24]
MVYANIENNLKIHLSEDLLFELQTYCSQSGNLETGGILIGYYEDNNMSANITAVTGPPSDSKHGRTTFVRGTKGLKKILDNHWQKGRYYLGEWHYHPYALPDPSFQDINQMKKISTDHKYHCPEPLMIIIGMEGKSFINRIFASLKGQNLIEFHPIERITT